MVAPVSVKLPATNDYYDLYALSGFPHDVSLIVSNNTGGQIRIYQDENKPTGKQPQGYPVWPNDTVLVHGQNPIPAWVKGGTDGQIIVQELTSTVLPFTGIEFPHDIVTSSEPVFRRLQTENASTSLREGRDFRLLRKIRLASPGDQIVYKFVCSEEWILEKWDLTVSAGNYEVSSYSEDVITELLPFSPSPAEIWPKNNSQVVFRPYDTVSGRYETAVTVEEAGTGAVQVDDVNAYRDYAELGTSGATAQRNTVGSTVGSQRYIPANLTFYVIITAINGPVRGVISVEWEERPPGIL